MKFERGYRVAREKTKQGSKFMRSCTNCYYFGRPSKMSKEDRCLNEEVSQYDIIVEGNNVYCTLWCPYTHNLNNIFGSKKTGRRILDSLERDEDD